LGVLLVFGVVAMVTRIMHGPAILSSAQAEEEKRQQQGSGMSRE
jgi:hypothetical protein